MAEYRISNIEFNREHLHNTHVFHFNLYIPYFYEFFRIREKFRSYSEMFLYLLSKYSERLQRIADKKKNCRKIYQPKNKNYQTHSVRITDAAHELLSDYSKLTGMSMSYLIRLLIEWERGDFSDERGNIGYFTRWEQNDSLVTIITELNIYYRFSLEENIVIENSWLLL